MKKLNVKKCVFIAGIIGFTAGVLCANLWMKEYVLNVGIFHEFFLQQYQKEDIHTEEYLLYLVKIRSIPLIVFAVLCGTRYKKCMVILSMLWFGFCAGLVLCAAIAGMKLKGITLCLIALVPHGMFYLYGYAMLFRYVMEYPMIRWKTQNTVKFIVCMTAGMFTECYVNPVVVQIFLKTLS